MISHHVQKCDNDIKQDYLSFFPRWLWPEMTWANWYQMCVLLIMKVEGCSTEDFLSPL